MPRNTPSTIAKIIDANPTIKEILEPYNIDILGLNCATGPEQMKEHIKYLSINSPFIISCIPNAGLPENVGGVAHYRLQPLELKIQLMHFVEDLGVRIIGGCCGTTPDHIEAISYAIKGIKPKELSVSNTKSSFSGLEPLVLTDHSLFINIGERANVTGSAKFARLIKENN